MTFFGRRASVLLAGMLLVTVSYSASAQPAAPGAADAGAADAPPAAPPRVARTASNVASFDILEYVVEGNRVLPAIVIEEALTPYLGENKGLAEVEQARDALEKAYHDAGYLTVLVNIPEQKVQRGVLRLEVVEGSVERLRVTGSRYYSLGYIRANVPSLQAGSVPYFPAVQEELAQLSRTADRRITPVLRPGKGPGKVDIDLKVEDQLPLHGSVELTNRQSAGTEELRLSGMLRYDNLWQREHSLTLNAQTAPQEPDQVKVASLSYLLPVPGSKTMLALYSLRSDSDVAAAADVNVIGNGSIHGLRAVRPLPSREGYGHSLTFGLDYKDFKESVRLLGSDTLNTPISYAPLLLQYGASAAGDDNSTEFGVGATFGVRGLFGSRDTEFENKRFLARANFFVLRADLKHVMALPAGWALHGSLNGQFSGQPLVSSEQMSAGGAETVRGYLEGERFGDQGLRGGLELLTPLLWQGEKAELLRGQVFVERALLRVSDPLPEQQARFSLTGAGVGLRLRYRSFRAEVDVAHAFSEGSSTRKGNNRGHFRLALEF